jgi:GT2 family glycosyltransferase
MLAVVNFNGGETLSACLRAVARQSLLPERILLIDNASTDDSCRAIEREFPQIEVLRLPTNRGFAAAANLAIQEAKGCRWVALLNADAMPSRRWMERMLRATKRLPQCASLSSQLLMARAPERLDGAGDVYHACGAAWRAGHGEIAARLATSADDQPREVFSACAAAAVYRRDAVLAAGGFDESFFCYFEDVDLGYRLRLAGHRAWHVPKAKVRHVGSASTGVRSDFAVFHGHRNLVWTFVRNTPPQLFWRHLPQHILWNLASVLWFTLLGRGRVILRAKWHALLDLPRIWRERKRLQAKWNAAAARLPEAMASGLLTPYFGRRR